jgi:hypothetical protein
LNSAVFAALFGGASSFTFASARGPARLGVRAFARVIAFSSPPAIASAARAPEREGGL